MSSISEFFENNIARHISTDRVKHWAFVIIRTLLIIGISYVILYPVFLMFSTAFMDPSNIYDVTVVWIPRDVTLDNFPPVLQVMDYLQSALNSFLLSFSVSVLHVVTCALIGYGFARYKFPGRSILFALVIVTLVVPPQTIMIPLFLHFRFFDVFGLVELISGEPGVNLLDSFWPFILQSATGMGIRNGLYILIFRQFFRNMPKEIEDAAWVDGAGHFRTFSQVMAPNAVAPIVTVFLFSFVWQWNDYFFASLFLERTSLLPLELDTLAASIGVLSGQGQQLDPYYVSLLNNTGSLLVIAPLLIMYVFLQRYFVESVERTGLVG
jgi:multiple sugar transport system permease protein